jgi:hypothetical protein
MKQAAMKLNNLEAGRYICKRSEEITTSFGTAYILNIGEKRVFANNKIKSFIEEHKDAPFAFTLCGIHSFRKRDDCGEQGQEITYVKIEDIGCLL